MRRSKEKPDYRSGKEGEKQGAERKKKKEKRHPGKEPSEQLFGEGIKGEWSTLLEEMPELLSLLQRRGLSHLKKNGAWKLEQQAREKQETVNEPRKHENRKACRLPPLIIGTVGECQFVRMEYKNKGMRIFLFLIDF